MNYTKKKTENLYVILVAILMVVAIVCAIAGAVNRSRAKSEAKETTGISETEAKDNEREDADGDDGDDAGDEDAAAEGDAETEDVFNESEEASGLPEFINPTGGSLVKDYSAETPVFSLTMEDYRCHGGVDVFVEIGERILATADGTVKEIWEDPMMGTCISIEHAGGAVSTYKNISPELPEGISTGTDVRSGQMIAVGGESALCEIAEEPHVHFEITVNGESVNPCDYIEFPEGAGDFEG